MMKIYVNKNNQLVEEHSQIVVGDKTIWIDMLEPTDEEKRAIESSLHLKIPSQEEMREIESSSRLYKENGSLFMTITVVKKNSHHTLEYVTFLVHGNVMVTIRYAELSSFALFLKTVTITPTFAIDNPVSLLLGILESIIEKSADTLEVISSTVELLSQKTFIEDPNARRDLNRLLITMGQQGEINSKTRDSLSSISRMISYLRFNIEKQDEALFVHRFESLNLDVADLKDYSAFLGHKIGFILDASLGLIQIEQNNIIKIFSVVAVVFLPPTLIASIYGMNFRHIPELEWYIGYPLALLLMVLSATLPYWYFKRKKWL